MALAGRTCAVATAYDPAHCRPRPSDDLFGTPQGSPRSDQLIAALVQRARLIMEKVDQVCTRDRIGPSSQVVPGPKTSGPSARSTVHPNVFVHRRQTLAVEITKILGQEAEINEHTARFSREPSYEICARSGAATHG